MAAPIIFETAVASLHLRVPADAAMRRRMRNADDEDSLRKAVSLWHLTLVNINMYVIVISCIHSSSARTMHVCTSLDAAWTDVRPAPPGLVVGIRSRIRRGWLHQMSTLPRGALLARARWRICQPAHRITLLAVPGRLT